MKTKHNNHAFSFVRFSSRIFAICTRSGKRPFKQNKKAFVFFCSAHCIPKQMRHTGLLLALVVVVVVVGVVVGRDSGSLNRILAGDPLLDYCAAKLPVCGFLFVFVERFVFLSLM
jgi:hypothetical protein